MAGMAQCGQWNLIRAELMGLRDGLLVPLETNGTNENPPGNPPPERSSGRQTVTQLPPNQALAYGAGRRPTGRQVAPGTKIVPSLYTM